MIGREWYAICVGMALGAMAVCLYWRIRVDRLNPQDESKLLVAFPLMLLVGVVGAVVADAVFTGDWRTWCACGTRRFGLTFMGFLLAVVLFLACYGRMSGIGGYYLLNALLPSLALGQAIGRIGCFLGGCCYGVPCVWGVVYPEGSLPHSVYGGAPLFPVQLVESGALFLHFGVCLAVPFRRRWWVYLGGVSAIRLGLDFFRGDLPTCTGLSPQQLVAVGVLVALGVSGIRNAGQRLSRRPRRYECGRAFCWGKIQPRGDENVTQDLDKSNLGVLKRNLGKRRIQPGVLEGLCWIDEEGNNLTFGRCLISVQSGFYTIWETK